MRSIGLAAVYLCLLLQGYGWFDRTLYVYRPWKYRYLSLYSALPKSYSDIWFHHVVCASFPGLFESSHGRLSQNSSLIISIWATAIFAFFWIFRCFSAWVLDNFSCSCSVSKSCSFPSTASLFCGGCCNSYYNKDKIRSWKQESVEKGNKPTSRKRTLPFLYISGSLL